MNIHVSDFGLDVDAVNPHILTLMNHLHSYLDKGWVVHKKNSSYILRKDGCKHVFCDGIYLKPTSSVEASQSFNYILCFLYSALDNRWSIKRREDKYIFIKKHEGQKEIFSNNYIHTFLKENFNFNLIK